jgi:hypothetical protein
MVVDVCCGNSRVRERKMTEREKQKECWVDVNDLTDKEIWDWCREHYGSNAAEDFRKHAATLAAALAPNARRLRAYEQRGEPVYNHESISDDDTRIVAVGLSDLRVDGKLPPEYERGWNDAVIHLRLKGRREPEKGRRENETLILGQMPRQTKEGVGT